VQCASPGNVRIKNQNKKETIVLNGRKIYELKYRKDFGDIKGLIFTFSSAGSVDFVRLKNNDGLTAYQEEF
jgi:hypothetical protein